MSHSTKHPGRFICLEGIDGAGKSYVTQKLLSFLQEHQISVVTTREPGGTPFANELAQLLLHFNEQEQQENIMPATELLLFFAARCQHLHNFIIPNLQAGKWVISDRYIASSYAYQGTGRALGWDKVESLEQYLPEITPDLVLLLDLEVKHVPDRLKNNNLNRFESLSSEGLNFFNLVRDGYLKYATQHPECSIIDASRSRASVWSQIEQAVSQLIK